MELKVNGDADAISIREQVSSKHATASTMVACTTR